MELEEIYKNLGISREVLEFGSRTEAMLKTRFEEIDSNAEYNQLKVIAAMQKNRVSDIHFSGTTGYGYNDLGRETLEQVYADVFHTEDALVRPVSYTHLDVYKRQAGGGSEDGKRSCEERGNPGRYAGYHYQFPGFGGVEE